MILVDDGLAVRALAGQIGAYLPGEVPTVAWGFYIRLLTALRSDRSIPGKHSKLATPEVIEYAADPPSNVALRDFLG